jgi:hypothetical protein
VTITPRRVQKFKRPIATKLTWSNRSLSDNREIQSGQVTVDDLGLITMPAVMVGKGRNRIAVRAP